MRKLNPQKKWGQHFLTDMSIARQIADTVDVCPDLPVLEVGPGMGVLTQFLRTKGRRIKAVEIDPKAVSYMREHFPDLRENIIHADFLQLNLYTLFDGQPFALTGNYPYDISSQIFFKLIDNHDIIPCCTGMIQREVAQRIASPPGCKAYGILSVLLQTWYNVEYLLTVDEKVFYPPPQVKSGVVRLTRNSRAALECDERLFRRVVKTSFGQRRKMLRGSLRQLVPQRLKNDEFFTDGLMTRRPEQLSVADFIALTKDIARIIDTDTPVEQR